MSVSPYTRLDEGQNVPLNEKSARLAFLANFFSHWSFSSIVYSQFFCRSTSSPRSSASAFCLNVSASLRCRSNRAASRAVIFAFALSSITEARFACADDR